MNPIMFSNLKIATHNQSFFLLFGSILRLRHVSLSFGSRRRRRNRSRATVLGNGLGRSYLWYCLHLCIFNFILIPQFCKIIIALANIPLIFTFVSFSHNRFQLQSSESFTASPDLISLNQLRAKRAIFERILISEAVLANQMLLQAYHHGF
jgi:hypothetical protein